MIVSMVALTASLICSSNAGNGTWSQCLVVVGGWFVHLGMSTSDEGCIVDTSLVLVVDCS